MSMPLKLFFGVNVESSPCNVGFNGRASSPQLNIRLLGSVADGGDRPKRVRMEFFGDHSENKSKILGNL